MVQRMQSLSISVCVLWMWLLIEPFTNLFRLERLSIRAWQGGWASFQNWKLYGSQIHSFFFLLKPLQLYYMLNLPLNICCYQKLNWGCLELSTEIQAGVIVASRQRCFSRTLSKQRRGESTANGGAVHILVITRRVFAELSGAGPRSLGRRCCGGSQRQKQCSNKSASPRWHLMWKSQIESSAFNFPGGRAMRLPRLKLTVNEFLFTYTSPSCERHCTALYTITRNTP